MATAQKQRNSLSTAIFPTKITTKQQSLVLVKRLLAIAVSCITYLRGIFPECAYGTRYLDDLCVKILREDKNSPSSSQLVNWMLGCYDALQKKYLRLIILATVTESYQFKFKYTDTGPSMDFTSNHPESNSSITCVDTKKASILMIRKIYVLMQNLGPLPDDVCLTMKLFYYDEVTPVDYQPPGFKEGDCDGMAFDREPVHLNIGEVPTPFHMVNVKVTTKKELMEHVDKTILRKSSSLVSPKAPHLGKEKEVEMDEDLVAEDKARPTKNTNRSLRTEELHLECEEEEEENAITEDHQSLSINNSQVEQLINKTSELEVGEGRTRSGKRFHSDTGGVESSKKQLSAMGQKRSNSKLAKPVYLFEFSPSQDSEPKRRKFSQPKEQF